MASLISHSGANPSSPSFPGVLYDPIQTWLNTWTANLFAWWSAVQPSSNYSEWEPSGANPSYVTAEPTPIPNAPTVTCTCPG